MDLDSFFLCLSCFFFAYSFTEICYLILYCTCKEAFSISHFNWPYQMKSWSCKFKRFCSANICKCYSEPQYKISFEFLLQLSCLNFLSRLWFLKKIKITCINNSILQNCRISFYKPGIRSINICKLIVLYFFMKARVRGQSKRFTTL